MRQRVLTYILFTLIGLMCGSAELSAQHLPERSLVRKGNRQFDKLNYRSSYNRYNEALEYDSVSYEALYNRANAYHQLRMANPADSTLNQQTGYSYYEQIAGDKLLSDTQRAEVYRNLGESLFANERYEAALNAFRESLLLNPDDAQTKYNYVLTKRIVDQKRKMEQQQNQDNQQNQDQNQNQNQDNQQDNQQNQNQDNKNNDQNQDNQQDNQQNQQNQDNQQDKQDGEQDNKEGEGENPENEQGEGDEQEQDMPSEPRELSADQARMLDAIQAEEDKTQDKLKEGKRAVVIPGKKNW